MTSNSNPQQSNEPAQDTHQVFDAAKWAELRGKTELNLTEGDLQQMRGVNDTITLEEVEEIYLPLARLINLYVQASQDLYKVSDTFLGTRTAKVPYIVGIAGSVAVGKSTGARVLKSLLSRWPSHPKVELVTTDGFLFPNAELDRRQLMDKKGFPESYDLHALVNFLNAVKSGELEVSAPVYSHLTYDVVAGESVVIDQPDILIVEGLTVLQTDTLGSDNQVFVSDFFDFSIYMDAETKDLRDWYVERFLTLRNTAFQNTASYFHRYANLSDSDATAEALRIWTTINEKNLLENIEPTRKRADLVLTKSASHRIKQVTLRKI